MKISKMIIALLPLGLAACASSSTTYTPDGRPAYSLNCSGMARTWGACLEKAGDLCGQAGYEVLDRTGEGGFIASAGSGASISGNRTSFSGSKTSGGFASSTHTRSMLVACKKAP